MQNNFSIFSSKYKHQHKNDVTSVTDPNTISEITSLKSEVTQPNITTKNRQIAPDNHHQRQVEGVDVSQSIIKRDINPILDPIPIYDANGNEKQQRYNNRYNLVMINNKKITDENVNETNVGDIQHKTKPKMSSSQKVVIDNEISLSVKQSKICVATTSDINGDKQLNDETYEKLLMEFKQSLNNFIDLNQVSLTFFSISLNFNVNV